MNKKNIVIIVLLLVLVLFLTLIIGVGFTKNPNVELIDYNISSNGKEIELNVGAPLYIGQIRGVKDSGGGVKPHYLNFYHTFGLISSWGAKYEYVIELDENDTEIYFNRADGGYELALQKDKETGEWVRP